VSKLGKALPPVLMAAAIVVAFGAVIFLTVWYSPGCRSPHKSISIGGPSSWRAALTSSWARVPELANADRHGLHLKNARPAGVDTLTAWQFLSVASCRKNPDALAEFLDSDPDERGQG
jgi:hypothetical protein